MISPAEDWIAYPSAADLKIGPEKCLQSARILSPPGRHGPRGAMSLVRGPQISRISKDFMDVTTWRRADFAHRVAARGHSGSRRIAVLVVIIGSSVRIINVHPI